MFNLLWKLKLVYLLWFKKYYLLSIPWAYTFTVYYTHAEIGCGFGAIISLLVLMSFSYSNSRSYGLVEMEADD